MFSFHFIIIIYILFFSPLPPLFPFSLFVQIKKKWRGNLIFVFDHDMIVEKPQTNGNIEQVAGIPSNTSLIFIALTKITQLANRISFL